MKVLLFVVTALVLSTGFAKSDKKTDRKPNQEKSSSLDIKLLRAISEGANMHETSRRVEYIVYNAFCESLDSCSFKGEFNKVYKITDIRANNLSTNIGINNKVSRIQCSNWFVDGKEKEISTETISCESE